MFKKNEMVELLQKEKTLAESIANRAERIPEHTALIYDGEKTTFKQLNDKADSLAAAFLKMGIGAKDRIAVILPTRPEFLYVWYAASKIGAAVVGLNVRYRHEEIAYMVNDAKPSVLVCINSFAGTNYNDFLSPILPKLLSVKHFVFLGPTGFTGAVDFGKLIEEKADHRAINRIAAEVDPAGDNFIIYTSGTTGRPKGAVLTQKSILAMMRPWTRNIGLNEEDKMFCCLPLNHVGGGTILALSTLASGATLVMADTFVPDKTLTIIHDLQCEAIGAVPTIYAILFSLPDFRKEILSSLQLAIYGGAAASPALLEKMRNNINGVIMACYGATEVSGFCTYTSISDPIEKIMITVGRAPEGVGMRIVDPLTRKTLAVRETGEVAIKGDLLIDRYLNMPEETQKAFDREGWFYTGDMGYLDEKGYLTLVGRYKEMYICGGYNVYPKEIEDVLMAHPAVAMAAVIGIPDEIKGEVGWAFVMKKPGSEVRDEELRQYCKSKLADYKVPSRIMIESVLPMTALGKIDKMKLKADLPAPKISK